jgi:hypothetical protein
MSGATPTLHLDAFKAYKGTLYVYLSRISKSYVTWRNMSLKWTGPEMNTGLELRYMIVNALCEMNNRHATSPILCHYYNPSGRTMTLRSTQPLTEISTRCSSLGAEGGGVVTLTTLPPSYTDCQEILWVSTSWNPEGLYRDCFTIIRTCVKTNNNSMPDQWFPKCVPRIARNPRSFPTESVDIFL